MRERTGSMRWSRRAFFFLVTTAALLAAVHLIAEHWVRERFERSLIMLGARATTPMEISVDVWSGTVRCGMLRLEPSIAPDGRSAQGHVDTLVIEGLSYLSVLRGSIELQAVRIAARDLDIVWTQDASRMRTRNTAAMRFFVHALHVDLDNADVTTIATDTTHWHVSSLRHRGVGGGLQRNAEGGWVFALPDARMVEWSTLTADFGGMSCFQCGHFKLDQARGTCELRDVHIAPFAELDVAAQSVPVERDVAACWFQSIRMHGLRLPQGTGTEAFSVRSLHVDDADIHIARDKTRPDGNDGYQPFVARMLRSLPAGCGADSILLNRVDITYRERGAVEHGFGEVPFNNLDAVITAARNTASLQDTCAIHARCTSFGDVPLDFRFTSAVQDTSDRYDVVARIGRMPARAINQALGPLADMETTSGTIDTVVMRMRGDDRWIQGTVRMAYRDLRMAQGHGRSRQGGVKPLQILMNAVIPNTQSISEVSALDGAFGFARKRDRAIFNHLWSGLREGSKNVLLPGILNKNK